jgi:hypothetical protein
VQELIELTKASPPHELLRDFAFPRLAFEIREKGWEESKEKHPRLFADCIEKDPYSSILAKFCLLNVTEKDPLKGESCSWHVHDMTARTRLTSEGPSARLLHHEPCIGNGKIGE